MDRDKPETSRRGFLRSLPLVAFSMLLICITFWALLMWTDTADGQSFWLVLLAWPVATIWIGPDLVAATTEGLTRPGCGRATARPGTCRSRGKCGEHRRVAGPDLEIGEERDGRLLIQPFWSRWCSHEASVWP